MSIFQSAFDVYEGTINDVSLPQEMQVKLTCEAKFLQRIEDLITEANSFESYKIEEYVFEVQKMFECDLALHEYRKEVLKEIMVDVMCEIEMMRWIKGSIEDDSPNVYGDIYCEGAAYVKRDFSFLLELFMPIAMFAVMIYAMFCVSGFGNFCLFMAGATAIASTAYLYKLFGIIINCANLNEENDYCADGVYGSCGFVGVLWRFLSPVVLSGIMMETVEVGNLHNLYLSFVFGVATFALLGEMVLLLLTVDITGIFKRAESTFKQCSLFMAILLAMNVFIAYMAYTLDGVIPAMWSLLYWILWFVPIVSFYLIRSKFEAGNVLKYALFGVVNEMYEEVISE